MNRLQSFSNFQRRAVLRWVSAVGISTSLFLLLLSAIEPTFEPSVRASSRQSRVLGAGVFHDKGCEHCHGLDGIGTDRGPDLSSIGRRWKKDHIELQIRNGGGGMPPFGEALQPDEVKLLVDYLSAKRKVSKKLVSPPKSEPTVDQSGS